LCIIYVFFLVNVFLICGKFFYDQVVIELKSDQKKWYHLTLAVKKIKREDTGTIAGVSIYFNEVKVKEEENIPEKDEIITVSASLELCVFIYENIYQIFYLLIIIYL
jgi:hypothetical protein